MNDPQTSLNALIDYIGILEQMLNVSWSNVDWKKYNLKYNPTMHLYNLQQLINKVGPDGSNEADGKE